MRVLQESLDRDAYRSGNQISDRRHRGPRHARPRSPDRSDQWFLCLHCFCWGVDRGGGSEAIPVTRPADYTSTSHVDYTLQRVDYTLPVPGQVDWL
ncbi:hypothetical protein J6590_074671 [Homalodisca vitripennis]|nr:hypothetical protein J6590_074671 [Homalodisca vitripennis]